MTIEEAIKRIKNDIEINHNFLADEYITALEMAIKALEQEPKRGKWVQAKDIEKEYAICTNCKHHGEFYMDYCPNCGARMESDEQ